MSQQVKWDTYSDQRLRYECMTTSLVRRVRGTTGSNFSRSAHAHHLVRHLYSRLMNGIQEDHALQKSFSSRCFHKLLKYKIVQFAILSIAYTQQSQSSCTVKLLFLACVFPTLFSKNSRLNVFSVTLKYRWSGFSTDVVTHPQPKHIHSPHESRFETELELAGVTSNFTLGKVLVQSTSIRY